jgi:hypothetical protein
MQSRVTMFLSNKLHGLGLLSGRRQACIYRTTANLKPIVGIYELHGSKSLLEGSFWAWLGEPALRFKTQLRPEEQALKKQGRTRG